MRDRTGKITSALYGKIYGDPQFLGPDAAGKNHVIFTYYLNPTPNNRNLEFDWRRNLALERADIYNPKQP